MLTLRLQYLRSQDWTTWEFHIYCRQHKQRHHLGRGDIVRVPREPQKGGWQWVLTSRVMLLNAYLVFYSTSLVQKWPLLAWRRKATGATSLRTWRTRYVSSTFSSPTQMTNHARLSDQQVIALAIPSYGRNDHLDVFISVIIYLLVSSCQLVSCPLNIRRRPHTPQPLLGANFSILHYSHSPLTCNTTYFISAISSEPVDCIVPLDWRVSLPFLIPSG